MQITFGKDLMKPSILVFKKKTGYLSIVRFRGVLTAGHVRLKIFGCYY